MAPRRAGDLRPLPVSPTVSSVKPSHYRPRPFPRPDRRPDTRRRESPRAAAEATRLRFLGRVRSERNDVGYHRVTRSVNETRPLRTEAHGAPPIETFLGLTGRLRSRRRRRSAPNSARLFRETWGAADDEGGGVSRPVSRVLYGGLSPTWRPFVWDVRYRTPRATNPGDWSGKDRNSCEPTPPLFGFAPGGVCRAVPVAGSAVGSYPTFSPLPPTHRRRFVLCGTFPEVALAGR